MSSLLSRGPTAITLPPPVSWSVSLNFTGIAPPPIRARFVVWTRIVSHLRERCEAPARPPGDSGNRFARLASPPLGQDALPARSRRGLQGSVRERRAT